MNIALVHELIANGLVHPAGMRAYEQRHAAELTEREMRKFRRNRAAWKFLQSHPPWYRKRAIWRLADLIANSAARLSVPELERTGARSKR